MRAEKFIRYTISPRLKEDRVAFQLVLPSDAKVVTGIECICEPGSHANAAITLNQISLLCAGHLSLKWNAPGDVFLQIPVDYPFFGYQEVPGMMHPVGGFVATNAFAVQGRQTAPMKVSIPSHRTLRGFYKDALNKAGDVNETYQVHLWLTYKTQ